MMEQFYIASVSFFFLKFGLHWVFVAFARTFSSCSKQGLLLVLLGLLMAVVSLVEHRL